MRALGHKVGRAPKCRNEEIEFQESGVGATIGEDERRGGDAGEEEKRRSLRAGFPKTLTTLII